MSGNSKLVRRSSLAGATLLVLFGAGCQPEYPNCDEDGDCSAKGEVCVNGLCQQCRSDANCAACQTCQAGRCQVVPGCCQQDGDCAVGQRCREGRCGPECTAAAECGPGKSCSSGRCVPDVECTGPGDCAAGLTCSNGRCVQAASQAAPGDENCELQRIHFDFDSSEILGSAATALEANARCLKAKGIRKLKIAGHCDERGSVQYNLALGERRARAARSYLQRLGISGIKVVTYGEERPVDRGEYESAYRKNRRAEFIPR